MHLRALLQGRRLLINSVCIYNGVAFLITVAHMLPELQNIIQSKQGIGLDYFFLIVAPLFLQLVSTIGLWYEKGWAFAAQIFLYLFQSVSYQSPQMTYSYFLGPHFFIYWNLALPDGEVVQGFNVLAIVILILLIVALNSRQTKTRTLPKVSP